MERELWKKRFQRKDIQNIPCCNCFTTNLKIEDELKITLRERILPYKSSIPKGALFIVSGFMNCTSCPEKIAFNGHKFEEFSLKYRPDGSKDLNMVIKYYFDSFYPNLRLFKVSKKVPNLIKKQIDLSFANFFSDLDSAANRIRTAVELILDDIGAPRKKRTKKGDYHLFKNLHSRIENYKLKKNKTIGGLLMGIKIVGNEGSHIGNLDREDLLDAYEIIELVLSKLYNQEENRIQSIAKVITDANRVRSQIEESENPIK